MNEEDKAKLEISVEDAKARGVYREDAIANARAIAARANDELKRLAHHVVPKLMESRDSRRNKYFRLVEIQERVSALIKPNTPCKEGCSYCCHMAVPVTEHEADRIAKYTGRKKAVITEPTPVQDRDGWIDRTNHKAHVTYMRVPCTFLGVEGDCTIYPVRPMPCRLHHVIESSPEHCDFYTEVSGANQVDIGWIQYATTGLFLHRPIVDIRDWFPTYEGG